MDLDVKTALLTGFSRLAARSNLSGVTITDDDLSLNGSATGPTLPLVQYGLSMSGAEMGHNAAGVPGTVNSQYTYNPISWYGFARSNGLRHFRIPFLAERAAVKLDELMTHVAQVLAVADDITVTLDMHNYSRRFIDGVEQQLGAGWTNSAYAAEWVAIASHATVKNNPRVSFDLMNEPHDLSGYANDRAAAAATEASHQAAVTALRAAGITNELKVEPYSWAATRRVAELHPSWWIDDPLKRTILSCHLYFDYSGEYANSYEQEEANARADGYPSMREQSGIASFVSWVNAQADLPAAELGEIGWPVGNAWAALADWTLDQVDASPKPIGWTYWGMNNWWDASGAGNMMLFTFAGPGSDLTGRRQQVDVLDVHQNIGLPKSVIPTPPTFTSSSYTIPYSVGVTYTANGATKQPGTYVQPGQVTVAATPRTYKYAIGQNTASSWMATLADTTIATNLAANPRAVQSGAQGWGGAIQWNSASISWLTGQTGWADGTTTAVSVAATATNGSSGNYVDFTTQDAAILAGVADGASVPVTIQGSRSIGTTLVIAVSWLNNSGVEIAENVGPDVTVAAGEKRTLTISAPKPSGASRFSVHMRAPSVQAGEVVTATNVCVGSSTFFDGSTVSTAGVTYSWTGTPNRSTSIKTTTA